MPTATGRPSNSSAGNELLRHAIQPVQQFAYTRGKNATDSALIIDAMDLLYAGNLERFVLVSSDSDFTRLATRLRESGMTVYGLGTASAPPRRSASPPAARFIYLDLLGQDPPEPEQPAVGDEQATPVAAQPQADPFHGDQRHVQRRRLAATSPRSGPT